MDMMVQLEVNLRGNMSQIWSGLRAGKLRKMTKVWDRVRRVRPFFGAYNIRTCKYQYKNENTEEANRRYRHSSPLDRLSFVFASCMPLQRE